MMNVVDVIQGSPEWKALRCGTLTGSRTADLMAKLKTGAPAAARTTYLHELVCERLTGEPVEAFVTQAMRWGIEHEDEARRTVALERDLEISPLGFVWHPRIRLFGASPDGLITDADGEVGLIEIKCPKTVTHVATLRGHGIDADYILQMQAAMACTGLSWCEFASYDPRLPVELQLFTLRVERDEDVIDAIEAEAELFLEELEDVVAQLRRKITEGVE
jgi:hypothetical protein